MRIVADVVGTVVGAVAVLILLTSRAVILTANLVDVLSAQFRKPSVLRYEKDY